MKISAFFTCLALAVVALFCTTQGVDGSTQDSLYYSPFNVTTYNHTAYLDYYGQSVYWYLEFDGAIISIAADAHLWYENYTYDHDSYSCKLELEGADLYVEIDEPEASNVIHLEKDNLGISDNRIYTRWSCTPDDDYRVRKIDFTVQVSTCVNGMKLGNRCLCYDGFYGTYCHRLFSEVRDGHCDWEEPSNTEMLNPPSVNYVYVSHGGIDIDTYQYGIVRGRYPKSIVLGYQSLPQCSFPETDLLSTNLLYNCRFDREIGIPFSTAVNHCGFNGTLYGSQYIYEGVVRQILVDQVPFLGGLEEKEYHMLYFISIRIPTYVSLSTSTQIKTSSPFPTEAVITSQKYNMEERYAIFELKTGTPYPAYFSDPVLNVEPLSSDDVSANISHVSQECDPTGNCIDYWKILAYTEDCYINAEFDLEFSIGCYGSCSYLGGGASLLFEVGSSTFCSSGSSSERVYGNLQSVENNYRIGSRAEFEASAQSSDVNVVDISILDVDAMFMGERILILSQGNVSLNGDFRIEPEYRRTNSPTKVFSFYIDPEVFDTPAGTQALELEATVQVFYEENNTPQEKTVKMIARSSTSSNNMETVMTGSVNVEPTQGSSSSSNGNNINADDSNSSDAYQVKPMMLTLLAIWFLMF